MELRAKLSAALKSAMKAREADRLSTLRLIHAAIKDRDIDARADGNNDDGVGDDVVLAIMGKMVKQRLESAKVYEEAGRLELSEKELFEVKIIEEFLPRQLLDDEVVAQIDAAIAEVGASSIRDMGKVMGILKGKYTGQIDFAKAGPMVKDKLG